jgi:glycosyltransferase involved in cell wall biosynthesis
LKVLHLITKSNWGGAQRCVFDLATGARNAGLEVVVALGGNGALAEKLRAEGVKVVSLPSMGRDIRAAADLAAARDIWRLIGEERPDILHLHSSKAGGLGALIGRIRNVPAIIFSAHGWAFNEPRPEWQRSVIRALHLATTLLAHKTVAVASAIPRQLGFASLTRGRFEIIRNGVDAPDLLTREAAREIVAGLSPAVEKAIAAANGGTLFTALAELHRIKGLDTLAEAAADLRRRRPEIKFGVVILGEGEARESLQSAIDSQGLGEVVALAGFAPDAPRLLSAFDAFVMPSRSEAMPLALLEAGAAGLACIATRVGGIPEVIEDPSLGILVSPERPRELAEALRRVAEDPEGAKRMGATLRDRVRLSFSKDRMSTETIDLYRKMCANKGRL